MVAGVFVFVFLQSLAELYLPTLMSDIVDTGIVKGDTPYIIKVGSFMLLIAAIGTACAVIASYISSKVAASFGKSVRNKVFTKVEHFSLQEFDQIGTASLITRTTNDIAQVQTVLTMMLRMMISAPMMCIGGIMMAVSKDAPLSLVLVVIVPFIAIVVFAIMRKSIPLFRSIQTKLDKLNLILNENLTGIRVIRSFHRMEYENKRFTDAGYDLMETSIKVNRLMATMMPAMMLILNLSTIAIIWFGGIRIDQGHIQVGDLMAFIQYAMQIMFSVLMVAMIFVMIPRASASAVRINEVIEMDSFNIEDQQEDKVEVKKGTIEFQDVTFRYPGAEQPVLSHISFTAKPGETIAIIGGTGAGKTTLVHLIPRFYEIEQGSIRIDGKDIRQLSVESLRANIGFVPQQSVLFSGTIAENIRYGKLDATDLEVQHAAEISQATEFIMEMKDQFESVISQGGTNLSGGQKQRLSIARALVRKPDIYIFDDSFSALDLRTEANLRKALKLETTHATQFIVAQRVSTVMDADQILVLDQGKIVGNGKHQDLLETCDVYREIVSSQLSKEEIA